MHECNEILNKIHNGYWINGVLRGAYVSKYKFVPVWRYTSNKKGHPTLYDSSLERLLTKMKINNIPCKVLTYDEYTSKMNKSIVTYNSKHGFRRHSGGRFLKLSLDDAKEIINMVDNGKSFQDVFDEFHKKSLSNSLNGKDINLNSVMTFAINYKDGLVKMPDEMSSVKQTISGGEIASEFDENEDNIDTVTSTMTVDLTKQNSLDTVNRNDLEDRISCLESKIDYLYENCVVENKNEVCEEKSWWKKIIQR